MVVARSYQILLPKIDFWPFSHWNSHWSPKNLRAAEGMVVERKQKLFWNQWTKWNILKPCRSWRNQIFWIRITLPKWVEHWLNMVEHCTSHLGGWVWTPLAPKKWHFGAPEPPKNDLFWSKTAILGHRQFVPNFVWIFFNRFLHLPF